jgi:hypothetical protein
MMSVRRTPLPVRADLTGSRSPVNDAPSLHGQAFALIIYTIAFEQGPESWSRNNSWCIAKLYTTRLQTDTCDI